MKIYFYFMYMSTPLLSSDTPEKGINPIADGCEPPCGCWDLNSGPLEGQSVLLTTEPSHQTPKFFLIKKKEEEEKKGGGKKKETRAQGS